ncbi:hypothetical protein HY212_04500 [Candidatus Pacearchaeota archaeon]|nr:hypothetical protein [Candidatus Pacearchaeota archaeon]
MDREKLKSVKQGDLVGLVANTHTPFHRLVIGTVHSVKIDSSEMHNDSIQFRESIELGAPVHFLGQDFPVFKRGNVGYCGLGEIYVGNDKIREWLFKDVKTCPHASYLTTCGILH